MNDILPGLSLGRMLFLLRTLLLLVLILHVLVLLLCRSFCLLFIRVLSSTPLSDGLLKLLIRLFTLYLFLPCLCSFCASALSPRADPPATSCPACSSTSCLSSSEFEYSNLSCSRNVLSSLKISLFEKNAGRFLATLSPDIVSVVDCSCWIRRQRRISPGARRRHQPAHRQSLVLAAPDPIQTLRYFCRRHQDHAPLGLVPGRLCSIHHLLGLHLSPPEDFRFE